MYFRTLILSLIVILTLFIFSNNSSFAQTQKPEQPPSQAAPQADLQARGAGQKTTECICLKPAVDAIQKAYTSLEEDEWPGAIKICKDTIEAIKTLSKTCKCPDVAVYQKTAEAFLKYAEGGNHLDGADEPDCAYALKLYDEAINSLKDSLPKITNAQVKENAKSIWEYAQEEQQFVKDECQGSQPVPVQGKQPPAKQNAPSAPAKQ